MESEEYQYINCIICGKRLKIQYKSYCNKKDREPKLLMCYDCDYKTPLQNWRVKTHKPFRE